MTQTPETWTVKAMLDWTEGYLERKGDEHPRASAQWLLSEATGLSRVQLFMMYDRELTSDELDLMRGYVSRRGRGEPLQYITGEVGFRLITVKVRPGVLIPRPETEVLVSEALALLPAPTRQRATDSLLNEYDGAALLAAVEGEQDEEGETVVDPASKEAVSGYVQSLAAQETAGQLLVADICTGSGCIACSLAVEHPNTRVFATDIAPEALALATDNVKALDLEDRVTVLGGDLGAALPAELAGSLDLIVSNPPYIPSAVMATLSSEVTSFEPSLALDGGEDGLDFFRRLLQDSQRFLKPGGAFAFELHEDCLDDAAEEARRVGFTNVRVVYDLAGKQRVLTGIY